jgi:hypothetical protein
MLSYITKKVASATAILVDSSIIVGKVVKKDIIAIPKAAKDGWRDGLYSDSEPKECDGITPGKRVKK